MYSRILSHAAETCFDGCAERLSDIASFFVPCFKCADSLSNRRKCGGDSFSAAFSSVSDCADDINIALKHLVMHFVGCFFCRAGSCGKNTVRFFDLFKRFVSGFERSGRSDHVINCAADNTGAGLQGLHALLFEFVGLFGKFESGGSRAFFDVFADFSESAEGFTAVLADFCPCLSNLTGGFSGFFRLVTKFCNRIVKFFLGDGTVVFCLLGNSSGGIDNVHTA